MDNIKIFEDDLPPEIDLSNEKINNSEALIGHGIGEFSFTGLKFFENKPLTIYTFAPDSNLKDLRNNT